MHATETTGRRQMARVGIGDDLIWHQLIATGCHAT